MQDNKQGFEPGEKVTYNDPATKRSEKGIFKSTRPDGETGYVAFNFNGDPKNYERYTGSLTQLKRLSRGWPKEGEK
jgi:hypothetical protein